MEAASSRTRLSKTSLTKDLGNPSILLRAMDWGLQSFPRTTKSQCIHTLACPAFDTDSDRQQQPAGVELEDLAEHSSRLTSRVDEPN
ncbi:hypothetical protein J6590_057523 [Homalodisca vitripennis]|nr:hypothetical protein J6590_057523 [Homalodisca vitripennis]